MKQRLLNILSIIWNSKTIVFLRDHLWVAGLGIVGIYIFFHAGPHFKELEYAFVRIAFAVLMIAGFLYAWWRHTVSEHIASGNLVADFKSVEAKHRLWFCFAVIALIALVVVECVVHP